MLKRLRKFGKEPLTGKKLLLISILILCLLACYVLITQEIYNKRIADIDDCYRKLCDTSYMIEGDITEPRYVDAYHELKKQILDHPRIFRDNYGSHVTVDILIASDRLERTSYLKDFRYSKDVPYIKAYFDYYPDELKLVQDAYIKEKGEFRAMHVEPVAAPDDDSCYYDDGCYGYDYYY